MSTGTPPVIPTEFQQYNSYVEDPKWQRKFSIIWLSLVGVSILVSTPHLVRSIRNGRTFRSFFGISEDLAGKNYIPVTNATLETEVPQRSNRRISGAFSMVGSVLLWSLPGIGLNVGQIFVIITYLVVVLVCITLHAPLKDNSNRAGFIALAQFPVVFLFATKNSLLSFLLGPGNGYEKLNYVHRWSGRCMWLGGVIHGSLWIRNHLEWKQAILGQQKETSGVAALGLLCVIVLSSLKPVRMYFYQAFFIIHLLSFVAFFVTICYHTMYASPWIFPPLALYGLDILMRMFRYRIKDATLVAVDNQMTIIRVADCDSGWEAGQHIRLRIFFSGRIFESHPLTIASAPPSTSCFTTASGILLGARVDGDWTHALNVFAQSAKQSTIPAGAPVEDKEFDLNVGLEVPIQVMLDGPYGGCSLDLGDYETILLFAGGSGATFTIGLLDDIVGRCVKRRRAGGEKTKRIEFAWCIKSFGAINWFAPFLVEIANMAAGSSLDLHISIAVTCLCDPEAVPTIPNSEVTTVRSSAQSLLDNLLTPPTTRDSPSSSRSEFRGLDRSADREKGDMTNNLKWTALGGGVGVCASGPETLTTEAANAVARLKATKGHELGGIALHLERFSM